MGEIEITILFYANDAAIFADNEYDLQQLLHQFNCTAKSFYIIE